MAKVDQPVKIRPVAYNHFHEPDSTIVTGESFDCTKPFLIVASKPIPRSSRVYFEFTITRQIATKSIRHLPIYVGLHKDPSYGILNNDAIMASCYYTYTEDFDIFEKQKSSMVLTTQPVGRLQARIPIVKSVIGFGVDTFENQLTIFVDGKVFYTFHTLIFDIDDSAEASGDWYFVLYSKLYQSIAGRINYGRYKTEYLPEGYCTLYQHYWNHENWTEDIESTLEVTSIPYTGAKMYNIDGTIDIENPYVTIDPLNKNRRLFLENKVPGMNLEDDNRYKMVAYRGGTYPDISTVNLPCPAEDTPVYIELTTKEALMTKDPITTGLLYIGVPIEVGLTVKKNEYTQKSFRVSLYHYLGAPYKAYSVYDNVEIPYIFPPLTNPAAPVQPVTVGFIFDRKNNIIKIVTEGTVFCTIPIQGVDFSDWSEDAYIFFKSADPAYKDYQIGTVEFGENPISYKITEPGVKTLYDYWNDSIRFYLEEPFPGFICRMKVRLPVDHYHYDFMSSLFVPRTKENQNGFDNGLNVMWNTFNVVTDTEPYENLSNFPSIFDYHAQMKEHLAFHSTKKPFEELIDSKIVVENNNFHNYFILTGDVTLKKDIWYDIDCWMEVRDDPPFYKKTQVYLHGFLNYARNRLIQSVLLGVLTLDGSNNDPGYPKYATVGLLASRTLNATWNKHVVGWQTPPDHSAYFTDTTQPILLALNIKPSPSIPAAQQIADIEIFYNDISLGVKTFDATTVSPRSFIAQTYIIPPAAYFACPRTEDSVVRITLTNHSGSNFQAVMVVGQVSIMTIGDHVPGV